jgi:hypothetical protein
MDILKPEVMDEMLFAKIEKKIIVEIALHLISGQYGVAENTPKY